MSFVTKQIKCKDKKVDGATEMITIKHVYELQYGIHLFFSMIFCLNLYINTCVNFVHVNIKL